MAFFQRRKPPPQPVNPSNGAHRNGTTRAQAPLDRQFGTDPVDASYTLNRSTTAIDNAAFTLIQRESSSVFAATPTIDLAKEAGWWRSRAGSPATPPVASEPVSAGAQVIHKALNQALEAWWGSSQLPPQALLRDGLLALQAGHNLSESQRSLLLRTALAQRKGMLTALRYQTDSERTATLLQEALLAEKTPLPPDSLRRLYSEDETSAVWRPLLVRELKAVLPSTIGRQRQLALTALAELEGKRAAAGRSANRIAPLDLFELATEPTPPSRLPLRPLLFSVVVLGLAALLLWQQLRPPPVVMVQAPAGRYAVGDAAIGDLRRVELAAFAIDRTEVTNRAYRACVDADVCPGLATGADATQTATFLDADFATFPVVNVDWGAAGAYCTWVGKRLPTAEEWEVAAGFAPATGRHYRFPWGNQFDPQLANSGATADNAAQPVGQYHPFSNSPLGARDMAGNVAEWTATAAPDGPDRFVVKGGSFQDEAPALQTSAEQSIPQQTAAPWLGFRCAMTSR